jgi:hypothetical protein
MKMMIVSIAMAAMIPAISPRRRSRALPFDEATTGNAVDGDEVAGWNMAMPLNVCAGALLLTVRHVRADWII